MNCVYSCGNIAFEMVENDSDSKNTKPSEDEDIL